MGLSIVLSLALLVMTFIVLHNWHYHQLDDNNSSRSSSSNHVFLDYFDEYKAVETLREDRDFAKMAIFVYGDVCIEAFHSSKHTSRRNRISVYNQSEYSTKTLAVSGSVNSRSNFWNVTFSPGSIPRSYKVMSSTAFFVVPTKPDNLHHFWEDEFEGIFSLAFRLGLLPTPKQPSTENGVPSRIHIFYKKRENKNLTDSEIRERKTFEPVLSLIGVHPDISYPEDIEENVCFRQAVFGIPRAKHLSKVDLIKQRNHILRQLKINMADCPTNQVTVIKRKARTILNVDELKTVAVSVGFTRCDVVTFQDLSIYDQIRQVACSRVLVGVQGSGLTWSALMDTGSVVMEISWPDKHWRPHFGAFFKRYNLKRSGFSVNPENVFVNWTSYERKMRSGIRVAEKERSQLLLKPPDRFDYDNIWKWADVKVDIDSFREKLLNVYQYIQQFDIHGN